MEAIIVAAGHEKEMGKHVPSQISALSSRVGGGGGGGGGGNTVMAAICAPTSDV